MAPRRRDRVRAPSPQRRLLGGGPHGGDAGPQGAVLRLRRDRPPGRHHGASRHAAAVPGYGARGGVRGGAAWRSTGGRVPEAVAPGAGRRHGEQHPPGWSGALLSGGSERRFRGSAPGGRVLAGDGENESPARQLLPDCADQPGYGGDRRGGGEPGQIKGGADPQVRRGGPRPPSFPPSFFPSGPAPAPYVTLLLDRASWSIAAYLFFAP